MIDTELEKNDSKNDVYYQLRNQILNMDIKPGERLSENLLSSQMNVGRNAVREALSRLVEEGYIVVYPQRGTEVTLIDRERIRQAVFSHTVLEQAMIEELCSQGLTGEQLKSLEEVLTRQKSESNQQNIMDFLMMEQELHYLFSSFCGREYSWEVFRTLDCDLLRLNYLQYTTFNYRIDMSSLTSWEHSQVEGRLLVDHLRRRDAEAASLICANHFNTILWNAGTLQEIYPQFFSGQA
ncbi:MAG: GntR family transcriptional regulator [Clostridiales bacterium]|jgi:DNA-binding GntR family transcriptional regulator|uniref:GntR family transcriptional regulator n=1 Tax=Clostridia TaxID=186801 RepID=UPI00046696E1|nr:MULTISPECIES: GntR family transcriptional regulator [Clostridia]MBS5958676.1 GntR family transcriptional regulator [Clostridiales bacterium]